MSLPRDYRQCGQPGQAWTSAVRSGSQCWPWLDSCLLTFLGPSCPHMGSTSPMANSFPGKSAHWALCDWWQAKEPPPHPSESHLCTHSLPLPTLAEEYRGVTVSRLHSIPGADFPLWTAADLPVALAHAHPGSPLGGSMQPNKDPTSFLSSHQGNSRDRCPQGGPKPVRAPFLGGTAQQYDPASPSQIHSDQSECSITLIG